MWNRRESAVTLKEDVMTEKNEKLEKMAAIRAKLDDVDHSLKALIEKVANIQLDMLDMPDKELDQAMKDLISAASDKSDILHKAMHDYEIKINALKQ
jgi:L-lactate utilization protein LutC